MRIVFMMNNIHVCNINSYTDKYFNAFETKVLDDYVFTNLFDKKQMNFLIYSIVSLYVCCCLDDDNLEFS